MASDFDISLWIDPEAFEHATGRPWGNTERWALINLMTSKVDGTLVPGTTHPMQDFVVDTHQFSPSDLYRPGLRSAWDIDHAAWIVPPERSRARDLTNGDFYTRAYMIADKMRHLLEKYPGKVKQFWDQLHRLRQKDQQAGHGDYSIWNVVYKALENQGLFAPISEATGEYIAKALDSTPPNSHNVEAQLQPFPPKDEEEDPLEGINATMPKQRNQ